MDATVLALQSLEAYYKRAKPKKKPVVWDTDQRRVELWWSRRLATGSQLAQPERFRAGFDYRGDGWYLRVSRRALFTDYRIATNDAMEPSEFFKHLYTMTGHLKVYKRRLSYPAENGKDTPNLKEYVNYLEFPDLPWMETLFHAYQSALTQEQEHVNVGVPLIPVRMR